LANEGRAVTAPSKEEVSHYVLAIIHSPDSILATLLHHESNFYNEDSTISSIATIKK
jgi:hypothetical protein